MTTCERNPWPQLRMEHAWRVSELNAGSTNSSFRLIFGSPKPSQTGVGIGVDSLQSQRLIKSWNFISKMNIYDIS